MAEETKKTAAKPKASKPKEETPKAEEPKEESNPAQEAVDAKDNDPVMVAPSTPQVETPEETQDYYPSPYGRRVAQKAVLYTDGISGTADMNHERAYEYSERLQSTNALEREAGDESLSEAALAFKSDEERREADNVKQGNKQ